MPSKYPAFDRGQLRLLPLEQRAHDMDLTRLLKVGETPVPYENPHLPAVADAVAAQFALGASCLAYFAFFAIADFTKHAGLGLSLAASGMLAIGSAIDWFQCRPGEERNAR